MKENNTSPREALQAREFKGESLLADLFLGKPFEAQTEESTDSQEENLIKRKYKEKGLTIATLAEQAGVSETTVDNWISGGSLPSYRNMKVLVKILDITLDELMGFYFPEAAKEASGNAADKPDQGESLHQYSIDELRRNRMSEYERDLVTMDRVKEVIKVLSDDISAAIIRDKAFSTNAEWDVLDRDFKAHLRTDGHGLKTKGRIDDAHIMYITKALVRALVLYIYYREPFELRTYDRLYELISFYKRDIIRPQAVSKLDLLFKKYENEEPSAFAVSAYNIFMSSSCEFPIAYDWVILGAKDYLQERRLDEPGRRLFLSRDEEDILRVEYAGRHLAEDCKKYGVGYPEHGIEYMGPKSDTRCRPTVLRVDSDGFPAVNPNEFC